MENYKEEYKKKGDKELRLKCLRTAVHVGYTGHRPLRNITIEHFCFIKRCSNHYNIIKRRTKQRKQEKEKERKKIKNKKMKVKK